MARFLRTETNSSGGHSRLHPPEVVTQPTAFVARPVQVHQAAAANSRDFRTVARIAKSSLPQVHVVGAGIAFHGPGVRLADPLSPNRLNRRKASYRLEPPTVVTPAPVFTAPPVEVKLAPSTRLSRSAHLRFPQVVYAARLYAPIAGYLTKPRDTSPATHSRLSPPAVVTPAVTQTFAGPEARLAPSSRLGRKAESRLQPPEKPLGALIGGVAVQLAYQSRGKPKSELFAPRFDIQPNFQGGVAIQLAPSFRGDPKSRLRPPVVVTPAAVLVRPVRALVRIRPFPTDASVFKPAVVTQAQGPQGGIGIQLAPQSRGRAKSFLRAPAVVTAVATEVFFGPKVDLARIKPAHTISRLSPPAVVAPVLALPTVTALAYSSRGKPKSRLFPPAVVGPVLAPPVQITLARIKPAATHSILRRPTDLVDQQDVGFVRVHLAYSRRGAPKSVLRKPVVVAPVLARRVEVALAPQKRGVPKSVLHAPTVVAPVLARPILTRLVRIKPAPVHSVLRRPVDLVDAADLGFVRTHLAYSLRGKPKSRLSVPTVVAPVLAPPTVVALSYSSHGTPKSRLFAPAVTAAFVEEVARPIDVTVAYSLRGKPKSTLRPPVVVAPVLAPPVFVGLAPSLRGTPKSRLSPPTVVAPVLAQPISTTLVRIRPVATRWLLRRPVDLVDRDDLGSVRVHLAYGLRGKAKPRLAPPTVVAPVLARAIDVTLVRIRPVRTTATLRRPVDLVDQQDVGSLRAHLAYSLRGKPKSRLLPPAVVAPVLARAIDVTLVRIRPVRTQAILGKPVDLVDAADLGFVRVHLAYQSKGAPKSRLAAPTVVAPVLARPITVKLVRITPPPVHSLLRRPGDLVDDADVGFVRVHLAYSLRGKPKSRIFPPAVVAPVLARPIDTTFVRIKPAAVHSTLRRPVDLVDQQDVGSLSTTFVHITPPPVHSVLRKPVVIDLRPQAHYLGLQLAYSRRGAPKSVLAPASLFTPQPKAETTLAVTLAYSLRGKPKSFLRAPVVVTAATPYLRPIDVTLAPQRRGKAKPTLRRPVVVRPFVARRAIIKLAPSRFKRPKSVLRKPVVVQAFRVPVISTTLVRITPPPVHSALRKPTDLVDAQDLGFVRVQLAPSRFPNPKSRLSPPTVVDAFRIPVVSVRLAPQRRGEPFSFLKLPTDTTGLEDQGRVRVSLARIRPVGTLAFLRPPEVVDEAEAFFGPSVTTVRIRPVQTRKFLIPPVVETQECYGDVVGFDFAPEVCGDDEGATVVGTTSSDQVSGSDSGATVQGASAAGGSVTGGDEKREGC